jgi:hypothetical protein
LGMRFGRAKGVVLRRGVIRILQVLEAFVLRVRSACFRRVLTSKHS